MYRTATGMETRIDGAPVTPSAVPAAAPRRRHDRHLRARRHASSSSGRTARWPIVPRRRRLSRSTTASRSTSASRRPGSATWSACSATPTATTSTTSSPAAANRSPSPNTPFAELYGTYVNSWRISNAESLFDYGPGQTTETFTDLTYPDAPGDTADPAGRGAGQRHRDVQPVRADDAGSCSTPASSTSALTGDADFANDAADAQEAGLGIPTNAGATAIGTATTVVTTDGRRERGAHVPGHGRPEVDAADLGQHVHRGVDVTIRGPNGAVVAVAVRRTTRPGSATCSRCPSTGTYTITVDPRVQQTGTMTFLLSPVADNTGTTAIGTPTTVTTTTIGENAERTFTGTAGQKLTLARLRQHLQPTVSIVTVRQPDGTSVAVPVRRRPDRVPRHVHVAGDRHLHVIVDPRDPADRHASRSCLSPVADNTGTTAIGTPTTVTTTTIGENAERTFTGTAGQKLTLHVTGNTFSRRCRPRPSARPDGTFVGGRCSSTTPTGFRDMFTLPVTGTYTSTSTPAISRPAPSRSCLSPVADNTGHDRDRHADDGDDDDDRRERRCAPSPAPRARS